MDSDQARQNVDQHAAASKAEMLAGSWWHSIDLGGGVITRGVHTLEELKESYHRFNLPDNLSGKRVLDIGCWDGFYSFESEKRGAEVVALDCWTPENFVKAKKALNSKIPFHELSVHDITPEKLGTFDIVLFLGVLYHLRHPLLALEQICEITREYLIVESHVADDFFELPLPVMEFYEIDELGGQYDNWWGPNVECLIRMLRAAGFARCELLRREPTRAVIKAFRHWDGRPTEISPSLRLINVVNAVTYDKNLPRRGRRAMLALSVEGLPAGTTRNDVRVEIGGFGVNPVFVGLWGGSANTEELQINVPVPPGLNVGPATVQLWSADRISNVFEITLSEGSRW